MGERESGGEDRGTGAEERQTLTATLGRIEAFNGEAKARPSQVSGSEVQAGRRSVGLWKRGHAEASIGSGRGGERRWTAGAEKEEGGKWDWSHGLV